MKNLIAVPTDFCATCRSYICCGHKPEDKESCVCPEWAGKFDGDLDGVDDKPRYRELAFNAIFHSINLPKHAAAREL